MCNMTEREFSKFLRDTAKRRKLSTKFDILHLLKLKPEYIIVWGERGSGKTYNALCWALYRYFAFGQKLVYIRRWKEDLNKSLQAKLWQGIVSNGVISYLSGGEWTGIACESGCYVLTKQDGDKVVKSTVIGYCVALSNTEHNKGGDDPEVGTVIFDEFFATGAKYLTNEITLYLNSISTIARDRGDLTMIMLGNPTDKSCPYIREMGLTSLLSQKPGEIHQYPYDGGTIVVERTYPPDNPPPSHKYFAAFRESPSAKMITAGEWEVHMWPHIPDRLLNVRPLLTGWVLLDHATLRVDVISKDGLYLAVTPFTERRTARPSREIEWSPRGGPRWWQRRGMRHPQTKAERVILDLILAGNVYFSDNQTGEDFMTFFTSAT